MGIAEMTIVVFITQIVFIATRNWNVKAVAKDNLIQILLSGALVHLSWLVSIAIGANSANELIQNWDFNYLPVILSSLIGGLLGSYFAIKINVK